MSQQIFLSVIFISDKNKTVHVSFNFTNSWIRSNISNKIFVEIDILVAIIWLLSNILLHTPFYWPEAHGPGFCNRGNNYIRNVSKCAKPFPDETEHNFNNKRQPYGVKY